MSSISMLLTYPLPIISSFIIGHQQLRSLIIVTVLLLLIIQLVSVHSITVMNSPLSVGTLLHAGPSCIIKPQLRLLHSSNGANRFLRVNYSPVKHRGICYSTLLCKQKGGVAIGKCGLGNSCCVFPQTCNSISVRNSTYFTSPDYPSLMNRSTEFESRQHNDDEENINNYFGQMSNNDNKNQCSLTIHRMPGIHPICRIRLDFIEYEIEGYHHDSSTDGNGCNNNNNGGGGVLDWITIKAMHDDRADIIEPICPSSKIGQHVIVDVRKHVGPFLLTVHTGSWSGRRRWNILINQIECNRIDGGSSGSLFPNNNEKQQQILLNSIDT